MINPSKTSRRNKKCESRSFTKDSRNKTSKMKLFVGSVSTLLLGMAILRLGKSQKTKADSSHNHDTNSSLGLATTKATKDNYWDFAAGPDFEEGPLLLTDEDIDRTMQKLTIRARNM